MATNVAVLSVEVLAIPGAQQITANAINDRAQVVGQFNDANGMPHGFIYEDGSVCQLDYPNARETNILDINNRGQLLGLIVTATATLGFIYDRGMFSSPLIYPGAKTLTIPNGINDRQEIVGVHDAPPHGGSFYYGVGGYKFLAYPGAQGTDAQRINDSRQIIGDFTDAAGTHGFVYLENVGAFTSALNCPNAPVIAFRGINNAGQIVGGCVDAQGNEHPFIYADGAMHPILIPGATSASVNDINDRGQITGTLQSAAGPQSFIAAVPF
ncbi:MAG TPA: hypothetical protein VJR04_12965 [Terriglobales bacterium]|nr:hypothetical protein [Terriglobales bacterium]